MIKNINLNHLTFLSYIIFFTVFIGCGNNAEKQTEEKENLERTQSDEMNEIVLTSYQLKNINIKIETADTKEVNFPLILSGRVALNEALTAHITSRIRGRIEKIHAVISDRVQKNEVLLELYSQDFLAMQSEFIQAEERLKRINENDTEYETAKSIYESAKKKLEVIGLTDAEIQNLVDNHTPFTLLPVRAPFSGTLLSGETRLGEFVEVGQDFFLLANLANLWVLADIFEKDLPLIREGMAGEIIPAAYPDESYKTSLTRVYDIVESSSRTIKARFGVSNSANKLKPEMFVTVKVSSKLGGTNPKVSSSAIMKEKNSTYLFIALNDTTFKRREISLGKETKDYTEILDGLEAGEKVVISGAFYLKSELSKETFMKD